jgi:hypothetical protein
MYCPRCGTQNYDNAFRCVKCQEIIQPLPAPPVRSLEDDPGMRMLLPVGRSGLAIAAGYAGLFAMTGVLAPLALILGVMALKDIKRNPKKLGKGRAIFGIIMGGIFSALFLFIMIGIAVNPNH